MNKAQWVEFTKRTNRPKLGYLIYRLKELGVPCKIIGSSFHAPILAVDKDRLAEAWALLSERHGRRVLDDMPDDHRLFKPFGDCECPGQHADK